MTRFTDLDARVERIEFGRTQKGSRFFKLIQLTRGGVREHCFHLRDYKLARDQIVAALSVEAKLPPECVWKLFGDVVQTVEPKLSVPTRPGLHEDCFVLPNGRVLGLFPLGHVFLPSADGSRIDLFDDEGGADEWSAIPELAHGNPLLTMAIAFAFTGPVAALLGIDAPRIQLVGSCGPLMSAVEDVVAAIWRRSRAEDPGYAMSWNQPRSVLDRIATERMHTMMVIDDTRGAVGADRRSGDDRHRRHLPTKSHETMGGARDTPIFSVSTDIAAARARRCSAVRGSLQDRLIDIALDDGRSWIEELHDYPDEATFLSALNRLAGVHSGFVANFLVGVLCLERRENRAFVGKLRKQRGNFLKMARNCFGGKGDHEMRHEAFATIFAAGAGLLVNWGNVSWGLSELTESLLVCEAAAIKTANEGF